MSKLKGKPFALWLNPVADQANQLNSLIGELSATYSTPSFAAHTTLCSGMWAGELDVLRAEAKQLAKQMGAVSLRTDGMDGKNRLLHFFYLRLIDETQTLFEKAKSAIKGSKPPVVGPHLSLMYCDRPGILCRASTSQALSDKIPTYIRFASLSLVTPSTSDWKAIESWEVLNSFELASA